MNKIQKFALTTSILFALALTLSCSSDDDKGGGYPSCSKMEEIHEECHAVYYDKTLHAECLDGKGFCGNSSYAKNKEECEAHYLECKGSYDCNIISGDDGEEIEDCFM